MKHFLKYILLFSSLTFCVNAFASSLVSGAGNLPSTQQAQELISNEQMMPRADWRGDASYRPVSEIEQSESLPRYGSHLFAGGFRGVRADGLNPEYRVVPGDQLTLRIWGAVDIDRILPVDAQGNIFIPGIGPVHVQGTTHGQLDAKVRNAVRAIYPENVHVYTNLQGVQPVAVFVTGAVPNPGRYAGTPNDAILYFLDQAGGVDDALGSYRSIRLIRHNKTIATIDLYDFLLNGVLPRPQFEDGDTIIVGDRGPLISVEGDVDRSYRYELMPDAMAGTDLLQMARPRHDVSHVLIQGWREAGPISDYRQLGELDQITLRDGDALLFSADQRHESIIVQVEGSFYGPSRYVLPKDTSLNELLNTIAVPAELADTTSISLRRKSVAERQRQSLIDSLRRLETTYLGASSATPEEAQIRIREAELISEFVKRASQVQPNGRMVVARDEQIINIRLQDGDVITIPERADSILISGEVLVPQSVVYTAGKTAEDYIRGAGGYSRHADKRHILVVRQNGEVRSASEVTMRPGDEILVLPLVPTKNLQLASTISQILYHIAIAAKVVLDL